MGVQVLFKPAQGIYNRIFSSSKQLAIAKMIEMKMAPYVPMDTGALVQTTIVTRNSITYGVPYAKKMYNGDDLNFSREKHPLATSQWDKAMMIAKSSEVSRDAERIIKR